MKLSLIVFLTWTSFAIWSSTVLGEEPAHYHDDPDIDHAAHQAAMDDMDLVDDMESMETADDMEIFDNLDSDSDHTYSRPHQTAVDHNMLADSVQQIGLSVLVRELEDISLNRDNAMGHVSAVRRKFQIATKLRQYDGPEAVQILRDLIKENACENRGEDDILCVKWAAEASLQEIDAKSDLQKLTTALPFAEKEKIIQKYTKEPYKNDFAVHVIKNYLTQQTAKQPDFAVPLLVELFTRHPQTEIIARQYPQQANKGLKQCFSSSNPGRVWWAINLARYLGKAALLEPVHNIAFKQKGNIDYANQAEVEEIQTMAIGFFRAFEQHALPYYRSVLYGDFAKGKEYVVNGIRNLGNPDLLALLKEYASFLAQNQNTGEPLLAARLKEKIAMMEAAGQ